MRNFLCFQKNAKALFVCLCVLLHNHFIIIMFHGTRKDSICMSTLDVSRARVNCNYIVSFVFSHAVRATSVFFYFFFHFPSRENLSLVRATLKLRREVELCNVMHFSNVSNKRISIAFRLFTHTIYLAFDWWRICLNKNDVNGETHCFRRRKRKLL